MKLRCLLTVLFCFSAVLVARAEKPAGWITKSSVIDTGWTDTDPMGDCPQTHYPVSIELMPLPGDGVRFKAVFIPKPSKEFEHKHSLHLRTDEYRKLDLELRKKGYVQISHQVVTAMIGNVHQAVWVRLAKEDKDAAAQESKPEPEAKPSTESKARPK